MNGARRPARQPHPRGREIAQHQLPIRAVVGDEVQPDLPGIPRVRHRRNKLHVLGMRRIQRDIDPNRAKTRVGQRRRGVGDHHVLGRPAVPQGNLLKSRTVVAVGQLIRIPIRRRRNQPARIVRPRHHHLPRDRRHGKGGEQRDC